MPPNVVVACQRHDRSAQKQLYEHFRDRVYRLAWRMVGATDADDLTQQVFLQTFQKIPLFNGDSNFSTWLYRLAVNECLQHLRRKGRHPCIELTVDPPARPEGRDVASESAEMLETALRCLDLELRSILLLREIEELSYAEIAAILECSEGTVASRLSRARAQLKAQLIQHGWSG